LKRSHIKIVNKKKLIRNSSLILIFLAILILIAIKAISFSLKIFNKSSSNNNTKTTATSITKTPDIEVLLSAVGDCTIGTDIKFPLANSLPTMALRPNNDFSYYFKNVFDILSKDDVTIANLETTFTDSNDRADKQFNFKASADYAKSLTLGSIEGVNLSNNHIYDFKEKGFLDTKLALDKQKIKYFGEGSVWKPKIKGQSFGFLGYRGWSLDKDFLSKLKSDITTLKRNNSVVIINFHWGNESQYYPIDAQKELAHFAIDNGADIILGHHPHVIQGIEQYKNRIIAYSLGNFCFGGNSNPTDKTTFIFQSNLKFTSNNLTSIGVRVIPCSISSVDYANDYRPTPLSGAAKLNLLNKLNTLSKDSGFKISDKFSYINVNNNK